MRIISAFRLTAALLASFALAAPSVAQVTQFPLYRNLDENGVDLVYGDFLMTLKEGSIGSGRAELSLVRTRGIQSAHQWDDYTFERRVSGGIATIHVGMPGGYFDEFTGTASATSFTTVKANGAVLTGTNGLYHYTSSDGTTVRFWDVSQSQELGFPTNFCSSLNRTSTCMLAPVRITESNGNRIWFVWDVFKVNDNYYDVRIAEISNSFGYSIAFPYVSNTWTGPGGGPWHVRTGAEFRNAVVSPTVQASVAYAYPNGTTLNLTDMAGQVWQITDTSIKPPGVSTPSFSVTRSGNIVSSVTKNTVTTTYNRVVNGNIRYPDQDDSVGSDDGRHIGLDQGPANLDQRCRPNHQLHL